MATPQRVLRRPGRFEPRLKAFEYLPTDTGRRPGPLSGIPVGNQGHHRDIGQCRPRTDRRSTAITSRRQMPGWWSGCASSARRFSANRLDPNSPGGNPGPTVNPLEHAITRRADRRRARPSRGSQRAIVPLALGSQTLGSWIRPCTLSTAHRRTEAKLRARSQRLGVHPLSPIARPCRLLRAARGRCHAGPVAARRHERRRSAWPAHCRRFKVDLEHGIAPLDRSRLGIVALREIHLAPKAAQQKVFKAAISPRARRPAPSWKELPLAEFDAANWPAINTILSSEGAAIFGGPGGGAIRIATSDQLKSQLERGKAVAAIDYLAAKAAQEKWRAELPKEMSGFDALLTLPAIPAKRRHGLDFTGDAEYCAPWTLIGAPAVTLPAGFRSERPAARHPDRRRYREDLRVLRVAKWLEAALGFDPGIPKIMS